MPPRPSRSGSSHLRDRGGPLQSGREGQSASFQGSVQIGSQSGGKVVVRRPDFGKAGRAIKVLTNACPVQVPKNSIYHYDVVISPSIGTRTALARKLVDQLQTDNPTIFQPNAGVYDGVKNLFMSHRLNLRDESNNVVISKKFDVSLPKRDPTKPPNVYSLAITEAAKVNPKCLEDFVAGKPTNEDHVKVVLMVMNIVLAQGPKSQYPSTSRSFFPGNERKYVGLGLELWRGYFQSVRPAMGKVILNFDISTAIFFKAGSLINFALDFFNFKGDQRDPTMLTPSDQGFTRRHQENLGMSISGIIVNVPLADGSRTRNVRVNGLSAAGANQESFDLQGVGTVTIAEYFNRAQNRPLHYPGINCIRTQRDELIPIEKCEVVEGQMAKMQPPDTVVDEMRKFSQKRPMERMNAVKAGLEFLGHVESEYIKRFGMTINASQLPMSIDARIINPPRLEYGKIEGKPGTVLPNSGMWNLRDMKFVEPKDISRWAFISFVGTERFNRNATNKAIEDLTRIFSTVGMQVAAPRHLKLAANPSNAFGELQSVVEEFKRRLIAENPKGDPSKVPDPDLIVVVLPDHNNRGIYDQVKYFGDVQTGIPTQCLQASKCRSAKPDYWANVALKVNLKLGGIDVKPDAASRVSGRLCDPSIPTMVFGADVYHPPPRSDAPSYAAVISNIDSDVTRYICDTRMQQSRLEMIPTIGEMVKKLVKQSIEYKMLIERKSQGAATPMRVLIFRDGVSEGQYEAVKDEELKRIKTSLKELNITPKITFIIVVKRHHFRFSPLPNADRSDIDRSGNTPAGTIVDKGIVHPTEFDFFLQAHGGLLGTSRSAHYHVLHDDNKFTADALQSLCFTLCHLFARTTRSITVPAPVAYADIACTRARASHQHGDFRQVHPRQQTKAYFA